MNDLFIIFLSAFFLAAQCSLLGLHLNLRKQSLYGDALSHALLPGLVLVFMLTGKIYGWPMLVGALASALITAYLIELLKEQRLIKEDAALGIVFTSMFALGVWLLAQLSSMAHIDTSCILFGSLIFLPLEEGTMLPLLGKIPNASLQVFAHFGILAVLLKIFHRPLLMLAFSPIMAESLGLNRRKYHFFFMSMLSLGIVSSFEVVGVILVIGFLSIPPAFARLWAQKFSKIYSICLAFSATTILMAYPIAYEFNINYSATIISLQFLIFLGAFFVRDQQEKSKSKPRQMVAAQ